MPKLELYNKELRPVLDKENVWTKESRSGKIRAMYMSYASKMDKKKNVITDALYNSYLKAFEGQYNVVFENTFFDHPSYFQTKDKEVVAIYQPYNRYDWLKIVDMAWDRGIMIKFYNDGYPRAIVCRLRREGEEKPDNKKKAQSGFAELFKTCILHN